MAALDELHAQIPAADIAGRLGADEGEVDSAIRTLVPVPLTGLQHNSQDPGHAGRLRVRALNDARSALPRIDR
jgi:hypothetical protein